MQGTTRCADQFQAYIDNVAFFLNICIKSYMLTQVIPGSTVSLPDSATSGLQSSSAEDTSGFRLDLVNIILLAAVGAFVLLSVALVVLLFRKNSGSTSDDVTGSRAEYVQYKTTCLLFVLLILHYLSKTQIFRNEPELPF